VRLEYTSNGLNDLPFKHPTAESTFAVIPGSQSTVVQRLVLRVNPKKLISLEGLKTRTAHLFSPLNRLSLRVARLVVNRLVPLAPHVQLLLSSRVFHIPRNLVPPRSEPAARLEVEDAAVPRLEVGEHHVSIAVDPRAPHNEVVDLGHRRDEVEDLARLAEEDTCPAEVMTRVSPCVFSCRVWQWNEVMDLRQGGKRQTRK
jgi:hypothetical protein